MDIFAQLTEKIIKEQENIIGPVAIEQAQKVPGLSVDVIKNTVILTGNKKDIVQKLIEKYRDLFGMASVEVCRQAAKSLLSQLPIDQVPPLLLS
ncbi:hypothetical protein BH11PAT1_BH11PAT1_5490 [soil metagenome]